MSIEKVIIDYGADKLADALALMRIELQKDELIYGMHIKVVYIEKDRYEVWIKGLHIGYVRDSKLWRREFTYVDGCQHWLGVWYVKKEISEQIYLIKQELEIERILLDSV